MPAAAGVVVGVIGAVASNSAAKKQAGAAGNAAQLSADASDRATALQRQMYEQAYKDATPYRQVGSAALNRLALMSGFNPDELTVAYTGDVQAEPEGLLAITDEQLRERFAPQFTTMESRWFNDLPNTEGDWYQKQVPVIDEAGLAAAISEERKRINDLQSAQQRVLDMRSQSAGAVTSPSGVAGGNALNFALSPDYQFRMNEGNKAIERSAAARGGLLSGATLKAMQRYGQDLASSEYGNAWNRMASLAGIGQTANQNSAALGANYAANVGNIALGSAANQGNALLAGGNARASAYTGTANALGNAFGNYMQYRNSSQPQSSYAGGSDQWTGNSPYAWD